MIGKLASMVTPSAPPAPSTPTASPVDDVESPISVSAFPMAQSMSLNNKKYAFIAIGIVTLGAGLGLGLGFGLSSRNAKTMRDPNANTPLPPTAPANDSTIPTAPKPTPISTIAPTLVNKNEENDNVIFLQAGKYKLCSADTYIKNNGSLYYENISSKSSVLLEESVDRENSETCHQFFKTSNDLIFSIRKNPDSIKSFSLNEDGIDNPLFKNNDEFVFALPSKLTPISFGIESNFVGGSTSYYGLFPGESERSNNVIHNSICVDDGKGFNHVSIFNTLNEVEPANIYSIAALSTEPSKLINCDSIGANKSLIGSLILFKDSNSEVQLKIVNGNTVKDTMILDSIDFAEDLKMSVDLSSRRGLITSNTNVTTFELDFGTNVLEAFGEINKDSIISTEINNTQLTSKAIYSETETPGVSAIHCGGMDSTTNLPVLVSILQTGSEAKSAQFSKPVITPINFPGVENYQVSEIQARASKVSVILTSLDSKKDPVVFMLDPKKISYSERA